MDFVRIALFPPPQQEELRHEARRAALAALASPTLPAGSMLALRLRRLFMRIGGHLSWRASQHSSVGRNAPSPAAMRERQSCRP